MTYKHCSPHNGRWIFRLSIFGKLLWPNEHFDTAEDAAIMADLTKHHLRTEFKLDLPASMDPEHWLSLVYSRRGVILSDTQSIEKALPDSVKTFISEHLVALSAHRDASPPETTASKFRRSGMINTPAVREWVEKLEAAESDALAFATVNSDSFFLRLKVVSASLTTALKSLRLAIRMHADATNPRLVQRGKNLAELVHNFQLNIEYVTELTSTLRVEQSAVETGVSVLENNRPALS